MPANYALHRFGAEALNRLPEHQQRPIRRFRRLFNGGLHGADLFFYYRPLLQTEVGGLYQTYGGMTGREFFTQACGLLKQNPSEGAAACLYGLLGNYCLYSRLAPLMGEGPLTRTELEVELDRYLLTLDGKEPAHTQDITPSLKMTRGECVTVSLFFPPATAVNLYAAYGSLIFWTKRMAAKKRNLVQTLLKATQGSFREQLMPDRANPKCLQADAALAAGYAQALALYPEMARQLTACRETGEPLGELFDAAFH